MPPDRRRFVRVNALHLPAGVALYGRSSSAIATGRQRRIANRRLSLYAHFIAAEILTFRGAHLGHGHVWFRVIVIGVPEQKSHTALLLGGLNLHLNILRRVSLRPPRKSLQPRTNHHSAVFRN